MSEDDTSAPTPGWYPDGHGEQRWWDGFQWTDRTLPPPPGAPMPATASGATTNGEGGRKARPILVGLLVVGVVALLALIVLNVVLLAS